VQSRDRLPWLRPGGCESRKKLPPPRRPPRGRALLWAVAAAGALGTALAAWAVPYKPRGEPYYLAFVSEGQRPVLYVADKRGFGCQARDEDVEGARVEEAVHVNVGSGITLFRVRRDPGPRWRSRAWLPFMDGVDGIKAPARDPDVRLRLEGDRAVEEWLWVNVAEH
jgi:hypothetical protein